MNLSLLIEALRQAKNITPLEKDILDTWNELQKFPIDRNSAQLQIMQNYAKYPEIFTAIKVLPTTTSVQPFAQATEADIQYNLEKQIEALVIKRGC